MGKIIVIALIAFLAFAWYRGWLGEWIGDAADSGAKAVRQTQSDARKQRPAEAEEKK
jgi:hypothetical protein